MEPIGDLVWDVILRNYRWLTDDHLSSGSVIIGSLLGDAEPLFLCIWQDTAGPGSSQYTRHF
jgi:hypothetical protein